MSSSTAHTPSLPPLRCDLVHDVLECMDSDITEEFIRVVIVREGRYHREQSYLHRIRSKTDELTRTSECRHI